MEKIENFNKHDAIKLWMTEHHPNLFVRFDNELTSEKHLGYCVITRDKQVGEQAGTVCWQGYPACMVEINFDVEGRSVDGGSGVDWFFNHNVPASSPLKMVTVSISDPAYFDTLEAVFKQAGLT